MRVPPANPAGPVLGIHPPLLRSSSAAPDDTGTAAQISQDVQLYVGEMFGDRLMQTPLSGSTPRLDDNVTFGGRYTYNFMKQLGTQLSGGYTPTRAGHVASGDSDLGLTT